MSCENSFLHRSSITPQDVSRKRIGDALSALGIFKETPELRACYDKTMARYINLIKEGFQQEFRISDGEESGRRMVHDLSKVDYGTQPGSTDATFLEDHETWCGVGLVPEHPVVRLFDLGDHKDHWIHADRMTPHFYDKSLGEKLILPPSHRDLLDILTSDISAFVHDFVENKSAGNVVLCKGPPGVGKTLTAEVYSEMIERPLYRVDAGNLGTSASTVSTNLAKIFSRAKRLNAVLLIDEADVYVMQRSDNLAQNAICAEFLQAAEYFDGLMFLTTNRVHEIDDAFISRCAAIIQYDYPSPVAASAIWHALAREFECEMDDSLVSSLVAMLPRATGRDIKMLLRLALRMSKAKNQPLSAETFRQAAVFRAIEVVEQINPARHP